MDTPDRPYFVWDGDCGFCAKWAGWVERTVRPGVAMVPFQELADLADADLSEDDVARASWWIPVDGPPLEGADGFGAALRAGEPTWANLAGRIIAIPGIRGIARFAYRRIADNRHRLPAPDGPRPTRHG